MAFSEMEIARYQKLLKEFMEQYGPQPEIRHKLRWDHQVEDQSVVLYEVRPRFVVPGIPTRSKEPFTRSAFAKATYVKKDKTWKVYWRRASGKFERYPLYPTARPLEDFLVFVLADENRCFLVERGKNNNDHHRIGRFP